MTAFSGTVCFVMILFAVLPAGVDVPVIIISVWRSMIGFAFRNVALKLLSIGVIGLRVFDGAFAFGNIRAFRNALMFGCFGIFGSCNMTFGVGCESSAFGDDRRFICLRD